MTKGENPSKGELTRQMIVAAAAPIFNQKGYEGCSLADLMAATGLQKGGIYRHFSSKEELAAAAFDYNCEVSRSARMALVDQAAPPLERLRQSIAAFVDYRSPVPGGCPILNTAVESDDGNGVLRARATKAVRGWVSRIQAMVQDAIEQGQIRKDADAKSVATVIVAALEGAAMMNRLERSEYGLRQVQQHLYRYLDSELAPGKENSR